jgi:hypothetical protein
LSSSSDDGHDVVVVAHSAAVSDYDDAFVDKSHKVVEE